METALVPIGRDIRNRDDDLIVVQIRRGEFVDNAAHQKESEKEEKRNDDNNIIVTVTAVGEGKGGYLHVFEHTYLS